MANEVKGKQLDISNLTPLDDGSAPEILCDGFSGASLHNGVLRLNLIVDRFNGQANQVQRIVTYRLAMPAAVAVAFRDGLVNLLNQMEKEGVLTPEPSKETPDGAR